MIERNPEPAEVPHAQRVLHHQFRPSAQLREGLQSMLSQPGRGPGFLFDSPRTLSVDLEAFHRSEFDQAIRRAQKDFEVRGRTRAYETIPVLAARARMVRPALLGVYLQVDPGQLQGITQDLFNPPLIGDERRSAEAPAYLYWQVPTHALLGSTAVHAALSAINEAQGSSKARLYTVAPGGIVGRDYRG